jgi:L-fuculose-phosphate aldolase
MLVNEFQQVGGDIFQRGLASSHGGNMSQRLGDRLLITRR